MLPEDSRCIAETHYQIGVAQGFNLQFDEAVASLEGAIKCLQTRIDKLKSKTESIGMKFFSSNRIPSIPRTKNIVLLDEIMLIQIIMS